MTRNSLESYDRKKTSWKKVFVPEIASRFKNHKNTFCISNENLCKLNLLQLLIDDFKSRQATYYMFLVKD